jgi:amino acid transporter
VEGVVKGYFIRLTKISLLIFAVFAIPVSFTNTEYLFAWVVAYLLSYLFVASNFLTLRKLDHSDHKKFYRLFLISLSVRFLLMIAALIFVLEAIKIHQIFYS